MAEKTTFIKLDRNILNWGWYKDSKTKDVFLHLLLTANVKPGRFLGVEIGRGEVATSYESLSKSLGISIRSVRTAILHLKTTGEVTIKRHPRFTVISIVNYDSYQANRQAERQTNANQATGNRQQSKNIRIKEIPSVYIPSRGDLASFIESEGLNADPDDVFDYYEAVGWEIGGKPIKDWRAVVRRWKQYEAPKAEQAKRGLDMDKVNEYLDKLERGELIYD